MPLIQRSLRNICIAVMLVYYHYINAVEDSIDACKFTYDDVKWDYIGKFNDVATYKWKREDSKLIVVRGTTVLNHHPSEIMGIFLNTSLATKWYHLFIMLSLFIVILKFNVGLTCSGVKSFSKHQTKIV
jgi:hypothetical protein